MINSFYTRMDSFYTTMDIEEDYVRYALDFKSLYPNIIIRRVEYTDTEVETEAEELL